MPKLAPVFASTTLVAGIVSFYLWQQLHAERAMTSRLRDRVAQLETGQARPALAGSASAPRPDQSDGQQGPAAEHAAPANAARAAATRANAGLVLNSTELLKDPDYREGLAISLRASIAQNYPNLVRELDLTPEQAGKLYDLLTKNQMAQLVDAPPTGADEATMRDAMNARQEAVRKQEADVASLLGDTKYQQWKDYQQSLPARQQVDRLRSTLEANGMPLAEQQQKQLTAALAADQKQRQEETMQAARSAPAAPRDQAAMLEESLRTTEQNNNRMVDVATPYLSSQQLDAFRKMQNQNLGMIRAMARAQRAQAEGQGGSGGSATTSSNAVVISTY